MENSEHSVVAVVKTTALKHPVLSVLVCGFQVCCSKVEKISLWQ